MCEIEASESFKLRNSLPILISLSCTNTRITRQQPHQPITRDPFQAKVDSWPQCNITLITWEHPNLIGQLLVFLIPLAFLLTAGALLLPSSLPPLPIGLSQVTAMAKSCDSVEFLQWGNKCYNCWWISLHSLSPFLSYADDKVACLCYGGSTFSRQLQW
jgi:hypothetical protein